MPVLPSSDGTTNPLERHAAPADRISPTLFTVASMSCMLALSYMLGSRARHLRLHSISRMNWVRKIVVLMYLVGIMFIATTAILASGWGVVTTGDCHASIVICLAFYLASKFLMYLFLVERAHVIRAPSTRRLSDKVWLFSMAVVCLGFTGLIIVTFLWPKAEISTIDSKCRVGLLPRVTIPLLSFDIAINIGFTVLFVCLLWPLLSFHSRRSRVEPISSTSTAAGWLRRLLHRHQQQQQPTAAGPRRVDVGNARLLSVLRKLVIKTVIGGVATMLPTTANLILLYILKNHELGWLCATVCSLDITWAIIVVHWLTVDPADLDGGAIDAAAAPSNASAKSATSSTATAAAAANRLSHSSSNRSARMMSEASSFAAAARPPFGFLEIPGCAAASPLSEPTTVVMASSDGGDAAAAAESERAPFGAVRKRTSISQSSLRQEIVKVETGSSVGGGGSEVGLISICSSSSPAPLLDPASRPAGEEEEEEVALGSVERLQVERRIS